MTFEYKLGTGQRAEKDTHEVEDYINQVAADGWRVVGYSAHGWRGVLQPGFTHLILFEREKPESARPQGE